MLVKYLWVRLLCGMGSYWGRGVMALSTGEIPLPMLKLLLCVMLVPVFRIIDCWGQLSMSPLSLVPCVQVPLFMRVLIGWCLVLLSPRQVLLSVRSSFSYFLILTIGLKQRVVACNRIVAA